MPAGCRRGALRTCDLMSMQPQFEPAETEALIARYGPTLQRGCQFHLDEKGYAYWWQVKAFVRRQGPESAGYEFGDCRLDLTAHKLFKKGVEIELTAKELGLGGRWEKMPPSLSPLPERTEYVRSWIAS